MGAVGYDKYRKNMLLANGVCLLIQRWASQRGRVKRQAIVKSTVCQISALLI